MEATKTAAATISREKFSSFVSGVIEGYPNPEGDPNPPGPWDPLIRQTFEKVFGPQPEPWRFGPHPEPWRTQFDANERLREWSRTNPEIWDVIGGRFDRVLLNPQPLPPRWALAAEFVRLAADQVATIQETADLINNGSDRGIIVVGGKISELVDFVCGNNFPRKFPPRGGDDHEPRLSGHELILIGAELSRHAKRIPNEILAHELTAAGENVINIGLERL